MSLDAHSERKGRNNGIVYIITERVELQSGYGTSAGTSSTH